MPRVKSFKTKFLAVIFPVGFLTFCAIISAHAQSLKTREIDLKECIQFRYDDELLFKTREDFLKAIRSDASRHSCLKNLAKIDFDKYTLAGVRLSTGDCGAPILLPVRAVKNAAEKQYVVKITYLPPGEPCRALFLYDLWLLVPKLPENYTVKFEVTAETRREKDQ
jgi:hypothetical protein